MSFFKNLKAATITLLVVVAVIAAIAITYFVTVFSGVALVLFAVFVLARSYFDSVEDEKQKDP